MNSVVALLLGLVVAVFGYKVHAGFVDRKIMQPNPERTTPAKMYVGGVVVNMLIEESDKALSSEFIANRIKMQRGYCEQIEEDFAGSVRAAIPLFDDEIRGVESLRRMSAALFA